MSEPAVTDQQVLDLELPPNDSGASTVREYLVTMLKNLWQEGEDFSGKRPFGTSGWEYDLYEPMVRAGMVEGTFDEDGYLDGFSSSSRRRANELVTAAILSLGKNTEG